MPSDADIILFILYVDVWLYKAVALAIMILCTVGNFCNCFVFLCIPALRKHPNALFLVASAVGSLFFIDIGLYSAVVTVFSGTNPLNRSSFLCKISYWLNFWGGSFSFMCNCFAAFGQFLITLPRIRWHRLITPIRAKLIILVTALVWLLIYLPLPIFYTLIPVSNITFVCTSSIPAVTLYGSYWIIISFYFLPIVLISILFSLTRYNLTRLLTRRRTLDAAVTRMMLIQMIVLLVSGIPAAIVLIYLLATQYVVKTSLRLAYEYVVLLLLTLATYATNGVSFWVYFIASGTFRRHIKNFLCERKKFKRRVTPFAITTTRINKTERNRFSETHVQL